MKKVSVLLVLFAAIITLQSFTKSDKPILKKLNIQESKIVWKGYKVTGSHEGTIQLKSGNLSFNGDKLIGGEFVLNMESITCTDLSGTYKNKLEGHLKSEDFFGTVKHPTASLSITKVTQTGKNAYELEADLTIKGIQKAITFDASVYGKKATANLKIDRTQFGIQYGSGSYFDGLKDKMIYDEFDLIVDISF